MEMHELNNIFLWCSSCSSACGVFRGTAFAPAAAAHYISVCFLPKKFGWKVNFVA